MPPPVYIYIWSTVEIVQIESSMEKTLTLTYARNPTCFVN